MDISTNDILQLLGSKELQIHVLTQQLAMLRQKLEALIAQAQRLDANPVPLNE